MDPQVALQAALTGLAQGAVYGLVALGFTLVHRLVRVVWFAHGDLVVSAAFVGILVTVGRTPVVSTPSAARGAGQVVVTLVVAAALAVAGYLFAVRPFLRATQSPHPSAVTGWVAASLAVGLLLRESLGLVFSRESYAVADPLRLDRLVGTDGVIGLGGVTVPARVVGVVVIGLVVAVATERFVARTRTGAAMRAVADDPDTAALMGIPAERVVLLAFVIAGLLAGLAGLLVVPAGPATVAGGVVLGLKGAAAAVVGRLGSLAGAVVAGLGLGVVESLAVASDRFGPAYADVLLLAVLVATLAVRPEGRRAALVVE